MEDLPDHLLVDIFSYLNKRDLCLNICLVCKRWNFLSKSPALWRRFTLLTIKNPSWCKFKLVNLPQTFDLIERRFSLVLQHIDISKLKFSFDVLQLLFKNCFKIKSLIINFKYLELMHRSNYKLEEYLSLEQIPSTIEYLYLKNVCDQKLRFNNSNAKLRYNLFEVEIIKLIKILLNRNTLCLKYLGFKCVDPTIITQECLESMKNIDILLLNNITDTDSVLEEMSILSNIRAIELCKCVSFDGNGLQDIFEVSEHLETLQIGKSINLNRCELEEIDWKTIENLQELYLDSTDLYQISENLNETNNCFNSFKSLNYLVLNNYEYNLEKNYFPYLTANNCHLRTFVLRPSSTANTNSIENWSTDSCFLLDLKGFLNIEYNIEYLDLIGLALLDTKFIISILKQLKNLK